MNKIWLITGAGGGIGSKLVQQVIKEDCAVCLTHNKRELIEKIGEESKNILVVETDLKSDNSVYQAVKQSIDRFGRIDIVVNNAGYELISYVEELDMEQLKEYFEINLWASIRIIKNVLPHMRNCGSGRFINMSSISGVLYSYEGSCAYNMAKVAMDSMSKSLASEVGRFGIYSTSLIIGQFRTNFLQHVHHGVLQFEDYSEQRTEKIECLRRFNYKQKGDVEKLCSLIIKISEMACPPKEMYVGTDAYKLAYNKAINILNNLKQWEKISRNMDINEI